MASVDPADVVALLNPTEEGGNAEQAVAIVTTLARAYTRGRGFTGNEPNDEIAAVITTAAARLLTNPGQILIDQTAGPFSQSLRSAFQGWTIAERMALDRYRVTAM